MTHLNHFRGDFSSTNLYTLPGSAVVKLYYDILYKKKYSKYQQPNTHGSVTKRNIVANKDFSFSDSKKVLLNISLVYLGDRR